LYSAENALNPLVFPSTGQMQQDIVDIAADLLGGDEVDGVTGWMTSGGTESILMAVKTARDFARRARDETAPEMVLATSAHAAFSKAAHYFDVREVRVPVGEDYRVDLDAMAAAVTDHTILVVGSAPQYPQGVIDPITEIAGLARDAGALCHVDACMGGFVLPFLARAGKPIPPFDFRVPGVTSMSADVHKYGYANKGASVVLYRNEELRKRQAFVFSDWLGGFYASSGVSGSKPTSPYAAAWAVLHYLGEDGYLRLAEEAWDGRVALEAGVRAIPGLTVVGQPEVTLCAIAAEDPDRLDVFVVGDELRARGWYFDRQGPPDSLHATVQAGNAPHVPELLADLAEIVGAIGSRRTDDRSTEYASLE
jgi:glutamate/tyrosine decarboxylase-like PLP-dependent enzyme